jgi:hypothetical protein
MKAASTKITRNNVVRRAGFVAAGCLVAGLISTPAARAQLGLDTAAILAGLSAINSTMQSVMQVPMQLMQQTQSDMNNFTQTYVYPLTKINSAQSLATQLSSSSSQIQSMMNTQTSSAQQPVSQQLEAALLSKDPNQVQNITSLYQNTFGALPSSNQAPTATTTSVDMGDAAAMESMKKAIQLDALADREMEVSQQLLTQLQTAAPGNAPVIAAQAATWVLQGHGYTQSALAQMLRAQSAELGYSGASMKRGSTVNGNSSGAILALPIGK